MKRYWLLTGLMMVLFLVLFGIAEWLHVPILTDPGPLLSKAGWVAAAGGVVLLVADVLLPAALLYALTGATARNLDNAALVFGLVLLVAGLFWMIGKYLFPLSRRQGRGWERGIKGVRGPAALPPPASSREAPPRPPGPGDGSPSHR